MKSTIKSRKYQCFCGRVENVETNHLGEIYSACPYCGNTTRTCIEDEAIEIRKSLPQENYILKYYRFNTDTQQAEYNKIVEKIKVNKTDSHAPFNSSKFNKLWDKIRECDEQNITIYEPEQFDNQYVGIGVRWYKWVECVFENKRIKQGYYLERV